MIQNPFFTSSDIPAEYFCDREKETDDMIRILTNGNNLVLKGPRRLGKSGLIHHVFEDIRIKDHFNTFYFDIYATSSLEEFTTMLGRAVYKTLAGKGKKFSDGFVATLKSLSFKIDQDPISSLPIPALGLQKIQSHEHTLNEIFDFLEKSKTPNIVAIDEFQQIQNYSEDNIEALLRTRIQRMNNTKFIFSGSERHLLDIMFSLQDNPFYQSARNMDIAPIPEDTYIDFAQKMFRKGGKKVQDDAVHFVYQLFDGVTYYLQETMNDAFSTSTEGTILTQSDMENTVKQLVISNASRCQDIMAAITLIQRKLLTAIAQEWSATDITSTAFVSKHNLSSASSVQSAVRALIEKKLVSKSGNTYTIPDKYLGLWLRMQ